MTTDPPPLTAGELLAILACLLTRPGINPHLIARVRALLDAAPEPAPEPKETP